MFDKMDFISIVSCRYNDLFFNSGYLTITDLNASQPTQFIFALPSSPSSIGAFCSSLDKL